MSNFVILDYARSADRALARDLELDYHPNFATIAPNSDDVQRRLHTAPRPGELREMIEDILEEYGGS
ncbi:MAG: hypothetical protein F4X26_09235 [Chloroflexi bacterium]|nr:hypothetical protein [Chloroflexota bacterium]